MPGVTILMEVTPDFAFALFIGELVDLHRRVGGSTWYITFNERVLFGCAVTGWKCSTSWRFGK